MFGIAMTFGISIPAFAADAHFTFTNTSGEEPELPLPEGGTEPGGSTPGGGTGGTTPDGGSGGGTGSGGGLRNALTSIGDAVRTGDHRVLLFVVLAIVAALVIGIVICSRKNLLVKRGRTLLSMILVAALAVGGLTTSFVFASDDAETQTESGMTEEVGLGFAETEDVIGTLDEEDPGGTGDADDETEDVTGVLDEDIPDGTDGSEEEQDPQGMVEDLTADPDDIDGEDMEYGIQPLATTNKYDTYAPYVEVAVDVVGGDAAGEALAEKQTYSAYLLQDESGNGLRYLVDVTVGVYGANGNCVTTDPGEIVVYNSTDTDDVYEAYPYYLLYSAGNTRGGSQKIYHYNGGVMSIQEAIATDTSAAVSQECIRGNTSFYIGGLNNNETVMAEESDSMARVLLNVNAMYVSDFGSDVVLSKGTVMSGSASGGTSESETNVIHLINTISLPIEGSDIYVLMTGSSTEVATGSTVTFIVERYDESSGTWSPASDVSYLLFEGCTGVTTDADGNLVSHDTENATQLSESEQATGTDGKITLTKTENGYPYIHFTDDEVYANVWEGMADGALRIVASSDGTDAAWGYLSGYDGEEQTGDPSLSLTYADTFYFGNDAGLAFEVEKEMLEDEECDEDFTFYLRQITSASSLPIVTESQILSYEIGAGVSYVVYDVETGALVGSGVTDANGAFTLKPGQYAKFSVPEDTTWQIYEGESEDYSLYLVEANNDAANPGVWGYADNASIADMRSGVVQDSEALAATIGTLILNKTDADDDTPLAGAVFSLYKDGKEIQSGLTTDANGQITVENCGAGTYYFVETKAPDGYEMPDSAMTGSVAVTQATNIPVTYTFSMKNEKETYYSMAYAVRIYGILADLYSYDGGETEATASLTFGPATSDSTYYHDDYVAHLTKAQYQAGGGYCIHWMTWEEVIQKCNDCKGDETELREIFGDCLQNGCTKAVELNLNSTIGTGVTYHWTGDGNPTLTSDTIKEEYLTWYQKVSLVASTDHGGYPTSRVRATLVGADELTESKTYAGDNLLTESNCLFSCFPSVLQEAIVPRRVQSNGGKNQKSYATTVYDKLWLFSQYELWGYEDELYVEPDDDDDKESGEVYVKEIQYEYLQKAGVTTSNVNSLTGHKESVDGFGDSGAHQGWWTRSMEYGGYGGSVWHVSEQGEKTSSTATMQYGLAPGFCLK